MIPIENDAEAIRMFETYTPHDLSKSRVDFRFMLNGFLLHTRGGRILEYEKYWMNMARFCGHENLFLATYAVYSKSSGGPWAPFVMERAYAVDWVRSADPYVISLEYFKEDNWRNLEKVYLFFEHNSRYFMAIVPWHFLLIVANPLFASQFAHEEVPPHYYDYLQIQLNCEQCLAANQQREMIQLHTLRLHLELKHQFLCEFATPLIDPGAIDRKRSQSRQLFHELWEFVDAPDYWKPIWVPDSRKQALQDWADVGALFIKNDKQMRDGDYYDYQYFLREPLGTILDNLVWRPHTQQAAFEALLSPLPDELMPPIFEHLSLLKVEKAREVLGCSASSGEEFPLFDPDPWLIHTGAPPKEYRHEKYHTAGEMPAHFIEFYDKIRDWGQDPAISPAKRPLIVLEYRHSYMLAYDQIQDTYIMVKIKSPMGNLGTFGGMLSMALLLGTHSKKVRMFFMYWGVAIEEYDVPRMQIMAKEFVGAQYYWLSGIYQRCFLLKRQGHQINLDWGDVVDCLMKYDSEIYLIMKHFWRYEPDPPKGEPGYYEPYPDPEELERQIYWKFAIHTTIHDNFVRKDIGENDPRYAHDQSIRDKYMAPIREEWAFEEEQIRECLIYEQRQEWVDQFWLNIPNEIRDSDEEIEKLWNSFSVDSDYDFPLYNTEYGLDKLGCQFYHDYSKDKIEPFDI